MVKLKFKNGQSMSTDVLIVVIVILFGALFLVTNQINEVQDGPSVDKKSEIAQIQADLIFNELENNEIVDSKNAVDVEKILTLNEQELRDELGIDSKFCIVFEKDGNLYKIDPNSNVNGVGSSDIIVNGVPCTDTGR